MDIYLGDDVKNALKITNDFTAKEFNTSQAVCFSLILKVFSFI